MSNPTRDSAGCAERKFHKNAAKKANSEDEVCRRRSPIAKPSLQKVIAPVDVFTSRSLTKHVCNNETELSFWTKPSTKALSGVFERIIGWKE